MTIKELKDFMYENCYSQIRYTKENCYYSIKRQKKRIFSHSQQNWLKKYLILIKPKNTINVVWRKKQKVYKTIKNSYVTTKSYRKP